MEQPKEKKQEQEQGEEKKPEQKEISLKEQRVRKMAQLYYSRADVRKNMLEFSKNRECVPRYFEGFGKRPDSFQFESDILEFARRGATSFHVSEELWRDPIELSIGMSEKQLTELRIGWDLLIDLDCKYPEFSKKAASSIIQALKSCGVDNVGIKFSVTGDTSVLIQVKEETKLISIKEAIALFKLGEKIKILSLNSKKEVQFSEVYDSLEHRDNVFNIFYETSKIPIKTTAYHSVFVFKDGEIIQKKVLELKKGDFLVTFNSSKNPAIKTLNYVTHSFSFASNQFDAKILKNKIKINGELMRLIGYYLAEGHVTNRINQVGFSFNIKEKNYIKDCVYLLKKITKKHISIRHPNSGSTQILIHSKQWASFFEDYCGKSKNKHLPSFSWNLNKSLFLELLKGYLRGDAYKIGEYGLVVKSVAPNLIKELVWLCKLNGISCSLTTEYNRPHLLLRGTLFKGSFVYTLKIPKSEISLSEFFRKRNKFSPLPRERTFPISGLKQVYQQIKPKKFLIHRVEQVTLRKERANLDRIKKVITWFKECKSLEFNEESKKIIKNYESLYGSDVGVLKVKEITEKKIETVFDVSVKETESFFGGEYPVLLHNSGSKGFHILVPWKAFPQELSGKKTSEMFPEWPRRICAYLKEKSRVFLEKEMSTEDSKTMASFKRGVRCETCKNLSEEQAQVLYICSSCKTRLENTLDNFKKKRIIRCPNCSKEMSELARTKFFVCNRCNKNSKTHPDNFNEQAIVEDVFEVLGLDVILVSSRHLFRMPYSLHEKTALASVVLNEKELENFDMIRDANPLKVQVKSFIPNSKPNEAQRLLIEALEYKIPEEKFDMAKVSKENQSGEGENKKYKEIQIREFSSKIYPPSINKILAGMDDGRKRALFILLSFFKSLKMPDDRIQKEIEAWNQKNKEPLSPGYIKGQLMWYAKNKPKLPPNFDKPYYKEIGIIPSQEELKSKNPVSYAVKKSFALQGYSKSN